MSYKRHLSKRIILTFLKINWLVANETEGILLSVVEKVGQEGIIMLCEEVQHIICYRELKHLKSSTLSVCMNVKYAYYIYNYARILNVYTYIYIIIRHFR